jgi:hypothetical protein
MLYKDIRPTIKSGDLLAFSHKPWNSWKDFKSQMVRVFTRSEYSHVALAWVVGNRIMCLEAVVPEVRIFPLSKLGDFYHISMNAEWKPETEEQALSWVGSAYSQLKAMRAYFHPLAKGDVSECAAYVLNVLATEGINLGVSAVPDKVVLEAQMQGKMMQYIIN